MIVGAVLIVLAWLSSIILEKATEFVKASGQDFTWIAIAATLAAGAVVLIAGVYAYKSIVSDKPLLNRYDERRKYVK